MTADDNAALDLRPPPDSERPAPPKTQAAASPLVAGTPIEVTVVVRRRAGATDPSGAAVLTATELAAGSGADPADVELVVTTLTALGAHVRSADPATRLIRLGGPAGRRVDFSNSWPKSSAGPLPGPPGSRDPTIGQVSGSWPAGAGTRAPAARPGPVVADKIDWAPLDRSACHSGSLLFGAL
jgi:hypothetical protein